VLPRYDNKPPARTDAELLYRVDPMYPPDAIRQHISGVVKLRLTVERDGTVGQVFLVSGPPLLVDAAINAARRWRYVPATENNAAKESSVDIGLVFQLP
jgi:protein TonB